MNELVTITGVIEYITFQNTENGYTVLDFSSDGELYTATGNAGSLYCGERVTMTGTWTVHPTFGKQFKIETCRREMPETAAEMLSYLASGIIKGVKEKTAAKIIEAFGDESFYVIEKYPERPERKQHLYGTPSAVHRHGICFCRRTDRPKTRQIRRHHRRHCFEKHLNRSLACRCFGTK